MQWAAEKLLRCAVKLATKREVPSRYYPSNKDNNFTYFWISHTSFDNEKFLPTSTSHENGLIGAISPPEQSRWPGDRMVDACLPFSQIGKVRFKIHRIYGADATVFSNPIFFILSETFRIHIIKSWLTNARETRAQKRFAKDFEFSVERIDILQKIIRWRRELSKQRGDNSISEEFSYIDLSDQVFSRRFWGLDDIEYYLSELRFVLESLVASGDLTSNHERYRLTGKSLESVSTFETEKQRFIKADRHDTAIRRLTWVIAIAAVVQAAVLLFGSSNNGSSNFPSLRETDNSTTPNE